MTVIYGPISGGAWIPGTGPDETIDAYGDGNALYDGYGGTNYLNILSGGNNNNLAAGPGADIMNGGTGTGNIASYQLAPGPVIASLANPTINTGWAAGDTYTNIHDLTGSPFGGSLYGDNSGVPNQLWALGGTNYLYGGTSYATFISGPGADHMVAGSGGGFADYEVATSGVTISLLNPSVNAGYAAGDTYSGIHNIGGSAYGDTIYGDNSGDNILGGSGNNIIHGGSGNDAINAGPGANTVWGGASSDEFVFGGSAIAAGDTHTDPMLIIANAQHGIYTTIMDFDQGNSGHYVSTEYDSIVVSQLVSSQYNHGAGQAVGALVHVVEDSRNSFADFQVDVDGSGTNWVTIAHLNGVASGDSVHVILDDSQQTGVTLQVQSSGVALAHGDFNGDGVQDWLLLNGNTLVDAQYQNGATAYSTVGGWGPEWQLVGSGSFLNDGKSAGLMHSSGAGGIAVVEIINGKQSLTSVGGIGNEWSFVGSGNFDGVGGDDILIRNTAGSLDVGSVVNGNLTYTRIGGLGSEWSFGGQNGLSADFLGDGHTDFLMHSSGNGAITVGEDINGTAAYTTIAFVGNEWSYLASGDFLGDGHQDFLMRNTSGTLAVGEYKNGSTSFTNIGGVGAEWQFIGSGDYLNDGKTGVLMHSTASGATVELEVTNGFTRLTGWGNEWHAQT